MSRRQFSFVRAVRGVTLIELMIAMMLGLLVVAAAIGIFLSNRQTFRSTDNLSRVQENARVGFELMARDLRQAGGSPCSRSIPIVNVLKPGGGWGADWSTGVRGYESGEAATFAAFGTAATNRIAGTDAIELRSGDSGDVAVTDHNPTSAQFKVSTVNHGLVDGDIVMVCDFVQGSIFQVTNAQSGINNTVVHNPSNGNTFSPGNCSKGLGYADPPLCTTNGTPYEYKPPSFISKLRATAWYIGANGRPGSGRSLYMAQMVSSAGGQSVSRQEVAEGVTGMQLQYLVPNAADYVDASAIGAAQWINVSAVRVELTLQSSENAGTGNVPLTREVVHVVSLRNRNP